MSLNSKIEWTHHTGNLWWGCTEVHEGCDNCYARTLAHRYGTEWGNQTPRKKLKKALSQFLGMQAAAHAAGEIHRVFVGSMMDIFEKDQPLIDHEGKKMEFGTDELRGQFFNDIVPACPNLLFLLLTKRPGNINKYIPEAWKAKPPKNVMFGTSPVTQKTVVEMIGKLKKVNGLRFLSVEPQLEYIDLSGLLDGIDWVIQGGESGPKKRPFNVAWAYAMRQVCEATRTPYFFKQIDKIQPVPADLLTRQFPEI